METRAAQQENVRFVLTGGDVTVVKSTFPSWRGAYAGRVPRRPPRSSLGLEFVDTVVDSPSLGMVADSVRKDLAQAAVGRGDPVLVLFLAHYLGKATLEAPELLRPRLRAMLVGWEIEELTSTLIEELSGADVLLGISDFNTSVFARAFPGTPAITVPVCPPLPSKAEPDRALWGLPEGTIVFLNVFNTVSGFDRKNPIDVHEAFRRAFPDRDDVRLVFKVHGGFDKNPDEGELTGEESRAAEFLARCAADDRVILVDEQLDYKTVLSLVSSCDVYVSLARAEGLGLPVLEAMALGVPTVAMDYAGHGDFVRPGSNVLVPYDVVEIGDDASHYYHPREYPTRPVWAQPRLDDAAQLLRELADDPELRLRVGEAGRVAARDFERRCAESTWVHDLEAALSSPGVRAAHPDRDAAFRAVVDRDRAMWLEHERVVRRARRNLRWRTRLGRVKRTLLGWPRRSV
ncbi:glycosyl transferase family 1 [Knoellia remsis]|uniref:Glycosyl transferase family 1 n=1 Tax=Knoellia remsis TaxID=407159 RepID=A0A2T0UZ63_9MICO|nr:glycosyltransferase family 4 protein [Knoellia remsis]PRY63225.1 glycosyl transferase family 1 [Knoellia remsis]